MASAEFSDSMSSLWKRFVLWPIAVAKHYYNGRFKKYVQVFHSFAAPANFAPPPQLQVWRDPRPGGSDCSFRCRRRFIRNAKPVADSFFLLQFVTDTDKAVYYYFYYYYTALKRHEVSQLKVDESQTGLLMYTRQVAQLFHKLSPSSTRHDDFKTRRGDTER